MPPPINTCRYFSDRFPNLVMGVWVFALQELGSEAHLGSNYWPGGPALYTSFIAAYNHMHPRVQLPSAQQSPPLRARPSPAGEEGLSTPTPPPPPPATPQLGPACDRADGSATPTPLGQSTSDHSAKGQLETEVLQPLGGGVNAYAGVTSSGTPVTLASSTQVVTSITMADSAPATIPGASSGASGLLDNSSSGSGSKGVFEAALDTAASTSQMAPSSFTTASSTAGSLGIPGGQASAGLAVIVGYEVDPEAAAADGGLGGGPGAYVKEFPRR
jgi:hypothetical protein